MATKTPEKSSTEAWAAAQQAHADAQAHHASLLARAATDTSIEPLDVVSAEHAVHLAALRADAARQAAADEQAQQRRAELEAIADRYLAEEPQAMAAFQAAAWRAEEALLEMTRAARAYGAVVGQVAVAVDAYGTDTSPRVTRSGPYTPPVVDNKTTKAITAGAWISRVARRALAELPSLEGGPSLAGRVPELTDVDPQLHPRALDSKEEDK